MLKRTTSSMDVTIESMKAIAVDAFQTTEHAKRSTLIARIIAQKQFVKSIKPVIEDGYCWYEGKRNTEMPGSQTGLICTTGGAIKDMKKTSSSDSLIKRASKPQPSMMMI